MPRLTASVSVRLDQPHPGHRPNVRLSPASPDLLSFFSDEGMVYLIAKSHGVHDVMLAVLDVRLIREAVEYLWSLTD